MKDICNKSRLKKVANAEIKDAGMSLTHWEGIHGGIAFKHKTASLSKVAAAQSKYLLSHSTIMASVATEDFPNTWHIKPISAHLVNQNEDAWSNTVLAMAYKTFRGAFNFTEHFQSSKKAKGHILDAILRKVHLSEDAWVYFVDLLVATDLSHTDLVNGILNGDVRYMSMGCVTDLVTCSFCGKQIKEGDRYCHHLQYQKGQFVPDDDGVPRKVAELCGDPSLPNGGVTFVEASWVATPAFPGAAIRNVISPEWVGPGTKYTSEMKQASKVASTSSSKNVSPNPTRAGFRRKFS